MGSSAGRSQESRSLRLAVFMCRRPSPMPVQWATNSNEGVMGLSHHSHAGDTCRLNIPARQIETVAHDSAGQPVPGHRHHWEFRSDVGYWWSIHPGPSRVHRTRRTCCQPKHRPTLQRAREIQHDSPTCAAAGATIISKQIIAINTSACMPPSFSISNREE
jgi:hypothetical protein